MNNSFLVVLDKLGSPVLLLVAIILRSKKYLNPKPVGPQEGPTLIIKLVGAGNFISMRWIDGTRDLHVLTLKSNLRTVQNYLPSATVHAINDRNMGIMLWSILVNCFALLFRRYHAVINMEIESHFAKFVTTLPFSTKVVGITNRHKSMSDAILYDRFIVSSGTLSRSEMFQVLASEEEIFFKPRSLPDFLPNSNGSAVHHDPGHAGSDNLPQLLIAPTCSKTDANRRLPARVWRYILKQAEEKVREVIVLFSDDLDPQYPDFVEMAKEFDFLDVKITKYAEFINLVENADRLMTVDSQALHVAQSFDKRTMCFYGPTSPIGIDLGRNTTVISRRLRCSPCTHLYFVPPCNNAAFCMDFEEHMLDDQVSRFLK